MDDAVDQLSDGREGTALLLQLGGLESGDLRRQLHPLLETLHLVELLQQLYLQLTHF
jgi:hypothetical protein